jgi:type II secretory pathway pseudopilin PulG
MPETTARSVSCARPPAPEAARGARGFTILEMAIVFGILGIILAVLAPMGMNLLRSQVHVAQKLQLQQLKDAVLGHALTQGRLPRPDSAPPAGVEDADYPVCTDANDHCSRLPYVDFQTKGRDAYGTPLFYAVDADLAAGERELCNLAYYKSRTSESDCSGAALHAPCVSDGTSAYNVAAVVVSAGRNKTFESRNAAPDRGFAMATSTAQGYDDTVVEITYGDLLQKACTAHSPFYAVVVGGDYYKDAACTDAYATGDVLYADAGGISCYSREGGFCRKQSVTLRQLVDCDFQRQCAAGLWQGAAARDGMVELQ